MANDLDIDKGQTIEVDVDKDYKANTGPVFVMANIRPSSWPPPQHFRASIFGRTGSIVRAVASAGWTSAYGAPHACFTMVVPEGGTFNVRVEDDFANNFGNGWKVDIFVTRIS